MRTRAAHGFTLIEVLVAVLVLAIGIGGAMAVQAAALRTRHLTSLMSGGVQLAASLADRMRANSVQMQAGSANAYLQLRYNGDTDGPPAPPGVVCLGAASCSSGELASFDQYEIKSALFSEFPGGRVAVCRDGVVWSGARRSLTWDCSAAPGAPLVIKLGWRDRRADSAAPVMPSVALVVAGAFP